MPEELIDRIIRVVAETQHIPSGQIKPESTFADLNIDSLDGVNILFALENEFNLNIPDNAGKGLATISDLARAIEQVMSSDGQEAGNDAPAADTDAQAQHNDEPGPVSS